MGSIEPGLKYIEQNLKSTITADELANMAGYSVWHYCRVFARLTGMPVAYYICKRRIDSVLAQMAGGRKGIDAALEYGFDTYAGFYKAFVRMYGCSPKKYLSLCKKAKGDITMTAQHKVRETLANWGIPGNLPIGDIYTMDGERLSENVWDIGGEYILKTGRRESLLKDMRLRKALVRQGFGSAATVATKTGAEYLDGESIAVLMKKIPGQPLAKAERFGASRREYGFKYGAAIARLHRALGEIEAEIMPDEVNLYRQISQWAMPETIKQNREHNMGLAGRFFDGHIEALGAVSGKLPMQLIHRDPNPSNILFCGGEVSGFIDFDLSQRNIRLWDPCYCATGILSEWRGAQNIHETWPDILEGILHGYDSVNPLTVEEKQAVFYVICSIQMVFIAWLEDQEGPDFAQLNNTNREMLIYLAGLEARIKGIF